MPLLDHFHAPMSDEASWEELHGAWPAYISERLNELLPPGFRSGVRIRLGTAIKMDVAAFEQFNDEASENTPNENGQEAWEAAAPTTLLDTQELTPPEYEIRVYDDSKNRQRVAAIDLVSPRNKDRPASRDSFVTKCEALLQQDVCVVIVDLVTERTSNLYAALADRLRARPPRLARAELYAVTCRVRDMGRHQRVETWEHQLVLGEALPTLPLWITPTKYVPLDLERTYMRTLQMSRLG